MNENLYSIQIEESVLSALMSLDGGIDNIMSDLSEDSFYAGQHKIIFKHIKKLFDQGSAHDIVVVYDSIRIDANDSKIIDEQFLINLNATAGLAHLIEKHVSILNEHARRRSLFNASETIKCISIDTTQYSTDEAISRAESVLSEIDKGADKDELKGAFDLVVNLYEKMVNAEKDRLEGKEKIDGVSTGFKSLDEKIGTLKGGDLVYIGARPSMGKTAFCLDIILSAGFYQQLPVLFHSIEMNQEKIMKRIVSNMATHFQTFFNSFR